MSGPRTVRHGEAALRLKLATRTTIAAVHGTALAAEITGSRQQRMSDCQLVNTDDFLRLDEVQALEEAAQGSPNWPAITRAAAQHHGFALLPLWSGPVAGADWCRSLADCQKEAGEASGKVLAAFANGHQVSAAEIRDGAIIEEIDQAIEAYARLRAMCVAEVERG